MATQHEYIPVAERPSHDPTATVGATHEGNTYIPPDFLIDSEDQISWAEIRDRDTGDLRYISFAQPPGWAAIQTGEHSFEIYRNEVKLNIPDRTSFDSVLAFIRESHNQIAVLARNAS